MTIIILLSHILLPIQIYNITMLQYQYVLYNIDYAVTLLHYNPIFVTCKIRKYYVLNYLKLIEFQ